PLVGPRAEGRSRVAAEGEGGVEVGGIRHGASGRAARSCRGPAGNGRYRRFRGALPLQCGSAAIMPSPRAILRVPRAATHAVVRFVRAIVVIGFAVFALALLAIRFVVFPQ